MAADSRTAIRGTNMAGCTRIAPAAFRTVVRILSAIMAQPSPAADREGPWPMRAPRPAATGVVYRRCQAFGQRLLVGRLVEAHGDDGALIARHAP